MFVEGNGNFAEVDEKDIQNYQKQLDNEFPGQGHAARPFVADGTVLSFVTTDWTAVAEMYRNFLADCYHISLNTHEVRGVRKHRYAHMEKTSELINKFVEHQDFLTTPEESRIPLRERVNTSGIRKQPRVLT